MCRHLRTMPLVLLTALCLAEAAAGAEAGSDFASTTDWPLIMPSDGGELRLYHPQVESFKNDRITARAAFSITAGGAQPTFGVVWLAARASVDRDARTITLSDQTATKVHLPGAGGQEEATISAAVTTLVKGLDPVLSLDRIVAALGEADRERDSAQRLDTAPPRIIVLDHRAILFYVDGQPVTSPLPGSRFERIENTPFLAARDPGDGACWLSYGGRWYQAPAIAGPWSFAEHVSPEVMALTPLLAGADHDDAPAPSGPPMAIVSSLEPAELVCTDGAPVYEPIADTGLLAVANNDGDLFLDTATQQHYVLLAGRWFRTGDLAHGAWQTVPHGALPQDFARIPPDSTYGTILAHVPGTNAADEAVLDAQVPQTAAVKRDATTAVTYDGEPQWQPIAGTALSYAANTPQQVIKAADDDYYCCAVGVWYHATSPSGPWTVAVGLPPGIGLIPPDNPLYNVRYVYIYDTTPDYVYVGYSPGYLGCYVSDGCVVWGTGFHYHPWHGHRFFPRPLTWGLGMAFNPWTGHWGVGMHRGIGGRTGGFAATGPHDGWWGPGGYRPVIARHRAADEHGANAPAHAAARDDGAPPSANLYRRPENHERVMDQTISRARPRPVEPPEHRVPSPIQAPERITTGRDGDVFRRQGDTWQQWQRGGWTPLAPEHARPASPAPQPEHPAPEPAHPPAPSPRRDEPPPHVEPRPEPPVEHREPPLEHREPPAAAPALPPVRREPPVAAPALPPAHIESPRPAPSQLELLDRQQRVEERGMQRSQQFQQYRANPPETLRRSEPGPTQRR